MSFNPKAAASSGKRAHPDFWEAGFMKDSWRKGTPVAV